VRPNALAIVAASCSIAFAASGIELADGKVSVNGAGGAAFAITAHNDLETSALTADPDGNFRNAEFNLAVAVRLTPRITIATQLFFDNIDGANAGLDWTFVEVAFASALKLRVGKIKLPLGISSETEAIGTLRPFYSLPDVVYGPTGLSTEAYYGVGITGELFDARHWTLSYDLFGGSTSIETIEPFERLRGPLVRGFVTDNDEDDVAALMGGRLILGTPIDGLSLRVSGYRGSVEGGGMSAILLSLDFEGDRWLVRAEAFRFREDSISHGGYLEVARFITAEIQIALQLQAMRTHAHDVPDDSSLLWHESVALGLNYWFTPGMVIKAAIEGVRGNRLAFPRKLDDALLNGPVTRETPFFTLGTQFSF
jgi:hypothetical protein